MSEDLDLIIRVDEEKLQPLLKQMETLRLQFIVDTTKFAAKWYMKTVKEYITKYPEVTLNMSDENLAEMKAKVNQLTENADLIVNRALSNPKVWWNLEPQLHDAFSQYEQLGNDQIGNKYPQKVDTPIRYALGELGKVLEQFGFNVATKKFSKDNYPEFWYSCEENNELKVQPYYPHLLTWSQEMQETLQKYNKLFTQAIKISNEIQILKEEKKKRKAASRWDSA
jgi:hypothetical protein